MKGLGKTIHSKTIWFYFLLVSLFHIYQYGISKVLSENIPVSDYAILFDITEDFFFILTLGLGEVLITVLGLSALFYCSAGFFLWYSIFGVSSLLLIETNINETLEYYTTIPSFEYFYFKLVISSCLLILMKLSFYFKQQAFKWINTAVIQPISSFFLQLNFQDWNYAYKFRFYPGVFFYSRIRSE